MSSSIWRLSHFLLAALASLFLIIASVTGIVLSFSPIQNELSDFHPGDVSSVSVADLIAALSNDYVDIIDVKIDENEFVQVSAIAKNGDYELFYFDPLNGNKIGDVENEHPVYTFSRNLHRSLFLKKTGRFIIGLATFFLLLIAGSGMMLIIKKQLSVVKFFSKVNFDSFYQYWHTVLSRIMLVVIVVISLSGIFLSLQRFNIIAEKPTIDYDLPLSLKKYDAIVPFDEFSVFEKTALSELQFIEFPFSRDIDEVFTLKLKHKELIVNQFDGSVIVENDYGLINQISLLSYQLHTGKGSIVWSLILGVCSLGILFFIFSGFKISFKRLTSKGKNVLSQKGAELLILVGSENGSSMVFARELYDQLIKQNVNVFIDELNNYKPNNAISQLLVITSTYGSGDPPANAKNFIKKFKSKPLKANFKYAVLGFGSTFYPEFCKYAIQVNEFLASYDNSDELAPIFLVNNQSRVDFLKWKQKWLTANNFSILEESVSANQADVCFGVVGKSSASSDPNNNFKLILKPKSPLSFQSGDLIAFKPDPNQAERLYSIGVTQKKEIFISVKKINNGICSSYLDTLSVNDQLYARVIENTDFHVPKSFKKLILIANGTGIAPFLGMANENDQNNSLHIYWGAKSEKSLSIYDEFIYSNIDCGRISSFSVAYSKDPNHEKQHVQTLIEKDKLFISEGLLENATIMICGSKAMGEDVLSCLEKILKELNNKSLYHYKTIGQIKVDVY